jgi:hypothetical protein
MLGAMLGTAIAKKMIGAEELTPEMEAVLAQAAEEGVAES